MKTNTRKPLLSTFLLGGLLFTSGCGTPTTSMGVTSRSDQAILSFSSAVPTQVRCEWLQEGARIQHQNTTPFRLVLPASRVREVCLRKPVEAARVQVKIRPGASESGGFVMPQGSAGLRLVTDGRHWESRSL